MVSFEFLESFIRSRIELFVPEEHQDECYFQMCDDIYENVLMDWERIYAEKVSDRAKKFAKVKEWMK